MNIHEYQAKAVLREFGVAVPRGHAAFSVDEAVKAAGDLGAPLLVVKAQIHAGGRGKAGGVKLVKSKEDVRKEAERLLGAVLVTHQTGPHGKQVHRLYIEEGSAIDREFYLSALVDRESSRVAFVASTAGGMEIEEVARTQPEQIMTFAVDPATGIMPHHGRLVAQALGLHDDLAKQAEKLVTQLYAAFTAATTPSAITSHFMMPPKMLTRMPFTLGSAVMILKAAATFSLLAPPPTSRKFAGAWP